MATNANYPVVEDAWGPLWDAGGATVATDRMVQVTPLHTSGVKRGRQYELDQVQSGEYSTALDNLTGTLDPNNAAGPWFGHIAPYQPFRKRMQYPATPNLLTQFQASGGEGATLGAIPASASIVSSTDANPQVVADATAWQGSNALQFAVTTASSAGTNICYTRQVAVKPGQKYTLQMRVRNVTGSTSLDVKPFISWYGSNRTSGATSFAYGSVVTLTGSTTAGWTQVTVTATAPASVYGMGAGIALSAVAAANCSVQVDGWQLEKGTSASAWVLPGTWYPVFAGFVERWPSEWTADGTYGEVKPTCTDALALLSQRQLSDPLTLEINANNPRFLYKLNDPSGSTTATDSVGAYPATSLALSKYGAGSLTFGTAITATNATGTYTGSTETVATFANPSPGQNVNAGGSYISLTGAGIKGPANPSLFTRMVAFRYTGATPGPSAEAVIWSANSGWTSSNIRIMVTQSGYCGFVITGPSGTSTTGTFFDALSNPIPVNDGNWHLAIVAWDGTNLRYSLDGVNAATTAASGIAPTGCRGDFLGGSLLVGTRQGTNNFAGDISFVAEFPSALTLTAMTNIYSAWKSSCAGESSGARYSRILRYAGYTGASSVATGLTSKMGPANDLDGTDALSALEAVVETENGAHFVAADGTITFKSRSARYNATTPAYTFGEGSGEFPYEDCQLDYDPTHLANQGTITQTSTSQNFVATDTASISAYGARTFTRSINCGDALECQDAANYLVSRYRNPLTRVTSIKLHPSALPSLWPVCLSLELGTRIRIMRRPFGAPAIQLDAFVESITWDFDDQNEAWCVLQCSPVDTTPYGVFAAWHSTLGGSGVTAGGTTLTVNASADTVNPLAAQIAPGQQLKLEPGTASAETVTVLSVGATSSGWTTAVITLTAGTVRTHAAGAVISELLTNGGTPTQWDSVAQLDSVAFSY